MLRVKRATMWAMVGRCAHAICSNVRHGRVDARHVALKLTATGRDVLGRARQAILSHEAWVKQRFSPEEQRTIVRLMTKLHGGAD